MQRLQRHQSRSGMALITVILVLAALLMLCTPFLLTARNADQSSQQIFSRAESELALESALIHSRAMLSESHFSTDPTPYFDSLDEVEVNNHFPEGFLDPRDISGAMWDVDARDVAGLIDLNSAPPGLLATMMGAVTRLVRPVAEKDDEIPVASTAGFDPEGFIWIGGELIHYGKIEGNLLMDLERGLGVQYDIDDNPLPGPRPAGDHGVGKNVLDQRAFALVEWRLFEGDLREFDSVERLAEADAFALAEDGIGAENLARLRRLGTVFGGVAAGPRWQRAARMVSGATRELTGHVRVDSSRWFNSGSTIQINDGKTVELAVVQAVNRSGTLILDRGLSSDYLPYRAEVRSLARRPVNINTAPVEVLVVLLENLKLSGRNQRVTGNEAAALAALIVESRPFEGLEDFMRFVVLPAAGIEKLPGDAPVVPDVLAAGAVRIIDPFDALAIYSNALNANDVVLEFSTMPFSFTTLDVYNLSLRTTINAPSGIERFANERERTEVVVPQEELFHAWVRQEDFDTALRLEREAPYWLTGPNATSRHDPAKSTPPTRIWAHLGTYEGQVYLPGVVDIKLADGSDAPSPEHVFADREPDTKGWVQLMPMRIDDSADPNLAGRVLHFDHETRDAEGRYLPDQVVNYPPDHEIVQWGIGTGLMRGMNFELWLKPRSHADAVLLDVSGSSGEADRLSILFEAGELVLRVLDGGGDHLGTPAFREVAEVRYSLATGEDPGLPIDVWSHIHVDVRGTRPSQMSLLVNGFTHGVRTPGLTRLKSQIDEVSTTLDVVSTEGFPERGVVRIGNELIEYQRSVGALEASHQASGADAGFGGRNARVRWSGGEIPLPLNIATTAFNHPVGAPVELYGFAAPLAADVSAGQSALPSGLGSFRVATVTALGGSSPLGDQINANGLFGLIPLGTGIVPGQTEVTGLELVSAEDPDNAQGAPEGLMEAFNRGGGYAVLMQVGVGGDPIGEPVGGWEVVRYSGWSGNVLQIASWGDALPELPLLTEAVSANGGGRRQFIVHWDANIAGGPVQEILEARLFVMPISIPAPGAAGTFPSGTLALPQFAQLTELIAGELTEWVCYNTAVEAGGQLVRDDPIALDAATLIVTGARPEIDPDDPSQPGGGGGGGGGGPPGFAFDPGAGPPATSSSVSAMQGLAPGPTWMALLGVAEDEDLPITRAVREVFQHRGVMGTFPHDHAAGTLVLPVFRAQNHGVDGGRPGKHDPVFFMGSDFSHIGWPVTVLRSHQPSPQIVYHGWQMVPGFVRAESNGEITAYTNVGADQDVIYFALNAGAPAPVVAGSVDTTGQANIIDTRAIARVTRFPSGERPRNINAVQLGGSLSASGQIPSALIDEVVFGATKLGMQTPLQDPESMQAPQLVLAEAFYDGDPVLHVLPGTWRIPFGNIGSTRLSLADLEPVGLLRMGDEILAYEDLDTTKGEITIAVSGRGLLGSLPGNLPGNYDPGTPINFLAGHRVGILSSGISATADALPLVDTNGFPPEGTVLIGRELIHYTRLGSGSLEMPAGSEEPGFMDNKAAGIFRGRYGSQPAVHGAGEPVILFPARYWDRWSERADGPELSYFRFGLSQPAAFWQEFYFEDEQVGLAGVRLGVLMRSDPVAAWDADPDETEGLDLFYAGSMRDGALPIGRQSDRIEWRVFVDYGDGAFDFDHGLAHGWRTAPRLRAFAASFVAPALTLSSVGR
ncbi:MAG TPA: hypothetical protein EYG30_06770 [Planctomycetes bacterium]|jgi:hypothetical protein|nr:hypothetical protein [Planctomycetota bacterium]HIL51940.1 hypothetical protein [Planctomycetota bacterium]